MSQSEFAGSDRYRREAAAYERKAEEEFRQWHEEQERARRQRADEYAPRLEVIGRHFPNLARALTGKAACIDGFGDPATPDEMAEYERLLGVSLPASYVQFLSCCRSLYLGDDIRFDEPWEPEWASQLRKPATHMVVIAEFWWRADGDQLVLPLEAGPRPSDSPVYYYAHSVPKFEKYAPTFTHFLEKKLARTQLFRELDES